MHASRSRLFGACATFSTAGSTIARPRQLTQTGDDASGDPPNNNSDHAKSGLLGNGGSRWGNVDEVVELNTVEDSVSDADVREVHAEKG